MLLSETHSKLLTAKENYEVFSRALRVHFVKYNTISLSKGPKYHIKIITYINNDNGFEINIAVVFAMSPQLGGIGPKSQKNLASFRIGEGGTL